MQHIAHETTLSSILSTPTHKTVQNALMGTDEATFGFSINITWKKND